MANITVTVQVGNSDDKLNQVEWSNFVRVTESVIRDEFTHIHFSGGSASDAPHQNYAFVFECREADKCALQERLTTIKKRYKQESIAWTEAPTTEFI